jgi:predicted phosphodiesterase
MNIPGRHCPAHYRYSPTVFDAEPALRAETLYVVGGLYGNPEALRAVLAMQADEERAGAPVTLLFNGDFNWFNADAESFAAINAAVLAHVAIQGNVETELAAPDADAGCGCAYPDNVGDDTVARSNAIMQRLRTVAGLSDYRARLAALPRCMTVSVGDLRIGVVHGDAESLAGWSFAVEALGSVAGVTRIEDYFRTANVRAFACSHTCLPVARDFAVDGARRVVINNGAAGMPNFSGTTYGVLTRISVDPAPPAGALYGTVIDDVRFDALPLHYDHAAWLRRFITLWPPGSPAYRSYHRRMTEGPRFSVVQADRLRRDDSTVTCRLG